ncbi:Hypothetical predicted protein [Mytilus galloprovincialis]|uniref:Uncharacterized protein n=1 Tax=Mytilus galloprovincialis TaxID=29158 RepID=A0A8B6C083_MYTGA|nr:Hypothetical predicted protein [Mytilus galloprovincialis]
MPYFISSDDIVAFNKEKSQEHYTKKRRGNGRTAAHTVEECLKVPEASTLSHQILAVLPSTEERDEMGEYVPLLLRQMANELKGLNQWLRDNNETKTADKDNREIREDRDNRDNHRDSREYRDYRDRIYHPYR